MKPIINNISQHLTKFPKAWLILFCFVLSKSLMTVGQTTLKFGAQGFGTFLPAGWAKSGASTQWAQNNADASDGDSKCAQLSGSAAYDSWLFTETFSAINGNTYYIQYYDKNTTPGTTFDIYAGTGAQSAANKIGSNLRTAALQGGSWSAAKNTATWTCTSTGTYWFGIHGVTSTATYKIDAVSCYETSVEPTGNPGTFTATASGVCTQIDLSFSAANTVVNYAVGYLILQRQGADPTGIPTDGTSYSVGNVLGDATVAAVISNPATTTATISGLTGSTNYHYSIIPYNYNGINVSSYNYKTTGFITANATTNSCSSLATEPSSQPASFTATQSTNCEQVDLTFSAASSISNCYGYLILRKQGSAPTGLPADANGYSVGGTIGDATVVTNITNSATTSLAETGVYDNTTYYYSIFPYNYDGSDPLSYNYLTTGFLSSNATTKYCPILIGNPIGNASGTWDDPAIAHHGNQANFWAANLYTRSQMNNASKIITSICVDLNLDVTSWPNSSTSQTLTNSTIWMANYSDVSTLPSEYSSEANLDAGTGVAWTQVYGGSINYSGLGWFTINLSTPFNYSGTGSLLVKFTRVSGSTNTTYPFFGIIDASPTSQIRQLNKSYSGSGSPASYKYLEIAFNSDCSTGDITLPIELTQFDGTCNDNQVVLTWQTASEKNNDFFTIDRSNDGKNFISIGSVKGAGNSSQKLNYTFVDIEYMEGISYYRLSQEDYDGTITHSKLISVEHSCSINNESEISIYPNPSVSDFIMDLKLYNDSNIAIEIYNSMGDLVKTIPGKRYKVGLQTINTDAYNLLPGLYYLKITINKKDYFQKLIKL